jgi:aldose 1-epimerase
MRTTVTLRAGPWEAGLLPELGGAIAYLTRDGRDVLRRTPDDADDPLATGCFPLVPYANRIAHGRFSFAGEAHQLPLNFGDHPHSLHGIGWQSSWTMTAAGAADAAMELRYAGDDGRWPWPFRAEQRLRLDDHGLTIALLVANEGDRVMPAGLGLHPYFPRDPSTRLTMVAQRMWEGDETMIPTRPVAACTFGNWSMGAGLPDCLIDNSFDGWTGHATIDGADGVTRIGAIGARTVHLYAPPGGDFLCAEPVSHLPDALNQGFAIDTLDPGETLALSMRIMS